MNSDEMKTRIENLENELNGLTQTMARLLICLCKPQYLMNKDEVRYILNDCQFQDEKERNKKCVNSL